MADHSHKEKGVTLPVLNLSLQSGFRMHGPFVTVYTLVLESYWMVSV